MASIWKQSVVIPVSKKRRSNGALDRAGDIGTRS